MAASTGVASTMIRLVAYSDQQNSGSRIHVMPGARILWMVMMKFRPVRMDENPEMNTPACHGENMGHWNTSYSAACRRSSPCRRPPANTA